MSYSKSSSPLVQFGVAGLIAVLCGASLVIAPVLLAIPIVIICCFALLYFAIHVASKQIGQVGINWAPYALASFWVVVINLPSFIAFDATGFSKDQGLFNPQSIGRIGVSLTVMFLLMVFWWQWGSAKYRDRKIALPQGIALVFCFYGWYLLSAPVSTSGTPLILAIFRVSEWIVACGLLVILFSIQTVAGQTSFRDRLKLVMPMLFFLLFSNLLALPIVPRMIYAVSVVTGTGRFGGLFTHPNLLALVCVLLCAYALAFLAGWKRLLLLCISTVALLLTYSRGGFAAFGLMIAFAIIFLIDRIGNKFSVVLVGLLCVGMAMQIPSIEDKIYVYLTRGTNTQSLQSFSERTAVWEASKILIGRSPWIGSGFIAGPKQLADVMIENRLSSNFAAPHAHNELLQAQISGGVLSLILSVLIHLRIVLLLLARRGLCKNELFFGWSVFSGCVVWGMLQPSLSYFLYLPGVLIIWLLLALESQKNIKKG